INLDDIVNRPHSIIFFFSSRRRHTSFSRDWSSDVCSSDLEQRVVAEAVLTPGGVQDTALPGAFADDRYRVLGMAYQRQGADEARSEERRVGKEGRVRRWWWRRERNESGSDDDTKKAVRLAA